MIDFKKISKVFYVLSQFELNRGRVFPSKAFQRVSNKLKYTTRYELDPNTGRVLLIDKFDNGTLLGNSSTEIFLQMVLEGRCDRMDLVNKTNSNLNELESSELLNISGIGESKAEELIKSGIFTIKDLESTNPVVGEYIGNSKVKFTDQMKAGLVLYNNISGERLPFSKASKIADKIISLINSKYKLNIYKAGSLRREKSTIGDIDLIIELPDDYKHLDELQNYIRSLYDIVAVNGDSKISGVIDNFQVDIRFIPKKFIGAHLLHATGSMEFNIELRKLAIKKGYSLNEYGITDLNTKKLITFDDEKDIFKFLNIEYVDPKNR